jgi:hypothetical protein
MQVLIQRTPSHADAALLEDYEQTCALEEESVAAALFEHLKIQEQVRTNFHHLFGINAVQFLFLYYFWCWFMFISFLP